MIVLKISGTNIFNTPSICTNHLDRWDVQFIPTPTLNGYSLLGSSPTGFPKVPSVESKSEKAQCDLQPSATAQVYDPNNTHGVSTHNSYVSCSCVFPMFSLCLSYVPRKTSIQDCLHVTNSLDWFGQWLSLNHHDTIQLLRLLFPYSTGPINL